MYVQVMQILAARMALGGVADSATTALFIQSFNEGLEYRYRHYHSNPSRILILWSTKYLLNIYDPDGRASINHYHSFGGS